MSDPAPIVSVTRRVRFAAARRLSSPVLDADGNDRLFGAGQRLHGRGFSLLVTLRGPAPAATGMIMDLKELSRLLKREVVAELDYSLLNDAPLLAGLPPTSENLAVAIWRRIEPALPPGTLDQVVVRESDEQAAIYKGE